MQYSELLKFINWIKFKVTTIADEIGKEYEAVQWLELDEDTKEKFIFDKTCSYLAIFFCINYDNEDSTIPCLNIGYNALVNYMPLYGAVCNDKDKVKDMVGLVRTLDGALNKAYIDADTTVFDNNVIKWLNGRLKRFYKSLAYYSVKQDGMTVNDVYSLLTPGANDETLSKFLAIYPTVKKLSDMFETNITYFVDSTSSASVYTEEPSKSFYNDAFLENVKLD